MTHSKPVILEYWRAADIDLSGDGLHTTRHATVRDAVSVAEALAGVELTVDYQADGVYCAGGWTDTAGVAWRFIAFKPPATNQVRKNTSKPGSGKVKQ